MAALQQIRKEQKSEDGMQRGTQDQYNLLCKAYANHQSFFTDHLYPERDIERDEAALTSFEVENKLCRQETEKAKQTEDTNKAERTQKN